MTATRTLEMLYYLVMNIGVVTDDGALSFVGFFILPVYCLLPLKRKGFNG